MYAVAFDLVVADTEQHHPRGVAQAYSDIGSILNQYGFRRVQGSLYVTDNEDMARLSRHCVLKRGFQNPCAIFARSALSNGRTLRRW